MSEGERLVQAAASENVTARLLGGVGIALRCESARTGALSREYGDLDLATSRRSGEALARTLEGLGYRPHREFNAAQGRTRLLFDEPDGPGHVDVFVGTFTMCHVLPLEDRLEIEADSLSASDLMLTKLQIAKLNRKDVIDAAALLLDHEVGDTDSGLNAGYIGGLLASDWGWWRTVTENFGVVLAHIPELDLDEASIGRIEARVQDLSDSIESRRKSVRWRARARVGDRVPWRDEPEDIG